MAISASARIVLTVAVGALLPGVLASPAAAQATGTITGQVLEATSQRPLGGAQVYVADTRLGALTNAQGRYVLTNVPTGEAVVRVTMVGYATAEQPLSVGSGATATANFELETTALALDEVVVTGTAGQARRREIGNTIAQIDADEIANMPIQNLGDVLQGRIAGGQILGASGQAGVGQTIRLRGNNSISQGNVPLIYIDGVRVLNTPYPGVDGVNQSPSPLNFINPEDIARVEIIKGAAAGTLYGTEASAGVIQIFTKRGAQGAARWTLSVEQGFNNLGHVGPEEDPTGLNLEDCSAFPGCPESGSWLRTGQVQDYNLSVQGGTEQVDYFVSGNWGREEGVIAPQNSVDWGARGNVGFSAGEDLTIQFNNAYRHQTIRWLSDGNNGEGLLINIIRGERGRAPNADVSPLLEEYAGSLIDHFVTGVNTIWTPSADLTHRFNAGLDYATAESLRERPWGFVFRPDGSRSLSSFQKRTLTLDYAGTWSTTLLSSFQSSLSWGGQFYDEFLREFEGEAEGFAGPGDKTLDSGALSRSGESRQRVASGGFFIQEMVGWNDRLFVTAGIRWDGYSTFGEGFGLVEYPKVSVAYTLSDHEFWPEWWDGLKLRAAVGESGKAPGVFDAERVWSSISGDEGNPAVTPANPGNSDLGPERTREIEGGFDGSLFGGRVAFEFTAYRQNTYDALIPVQQIPSHGFIGTQLENVGELLNWGTESMIDFRVVDGPDLQWDVGLRYSTSESEAVDLGGLESIAALSPIWYQFIRPGYPIPSYFGPVVTNPQAVGVPPEYEERYVGSVFPTWTFGVNTAVTLGGLTVNVLGEAQGGNHLTSGTARQQVRRDLWPACQGIRERVLEGDIEGLTALQQADCAENPSYIDWTEPADFFKLRQISLNYQVPDHWLVGGMTSAAIRLMGSNLFTITDFPGLDPESIEDGSREISLYRVEYYNLPPARQFRLGVTVTF